MKPEQEKVVEALEEGRISEEKAIELVLNMDPILHSFMNKEEVKRALQKRRDAVISIRAL